ncbi:MAG: S9 family peptidase [Anaerolineales bacterium]|nr:S9 family peptidase [Anaerolineales bacterium]
MAKIEIEEKYEHNGWPSIDRPDLKPTKGWSLELLAGIHRIRNHQLSPNGKQIVFIWDREDLSDVYILPSRGGWPQRISFDRRPIAYWEDETPQWSSDGQRIAFTSNEHVYVSHPAGALPEKVSDFTSQASSPVWMPDGQHLVISVERQDATQLLLTDAEGAWPRPLVTDPTGDAWDARPAPDGRWVAFTFRPFDDLHRLDLRVVEVASAQVRTLAGLPKVRMLSPRWRPDGAQIAFLSQQTGFFEVWLVNPDGSGLRQLTHLELDCVEIAWAPDGKRLACTLNRGGAYDLALLDAESGEPTSLRSSGGIHYRPNWSPKGDFITFEYEDPLLPPDLYRIDLSSGKTVQLTFSNPPSLADKSLVIPELVHYPSADGLQIPAFLYRPKTPNGAAILHPHGGPSAQYILDWDIHAQYLVARGYTFLAANYRGSTGYGIAFEHANYNDWGKGDMQDCLHGAKFLRTLPGIDPLRIAIMGGSYGGYMTACCLSRDPEYLFACGVCLYGDANLVSSWAQCSRTLRLYSEIFLGHPSRNRQVYLDGSPIYQVENVRKPVLLLHGLLDDVVPPQSSEEWVRELRRAGKTFEYKTYSGEPHGFLKRATCLDSWQRIQRFLDWYLLP